MNIPHYLEIGEDYARFAPRGNATLVEVAELVSEAVTFCRENRIERLLADVTGLLGFASPTLIDRFLLAEEWADAARGAVILALLLKPEHIHPRNFGLVVANDKGLVTETFTTQEEAHAWLMNHSSADRNAEVKR